MVEERFFRTVFRIINKEPFPSQKTKQKPKLPLPNQTKPTKPQTINQNQTNQPQKPQNTLKKTNQNNPKTLISFNLADIDQLIIKLK